MAERQTKKSRAYHEAGHGVIARVLTLPSGRATIRPNYRKLRWGYSITFDPHACLYEWEKRGKVRGNLDAVWHARIISFMAGAKTEAELLGHTSLGDGDDRQQIRLMAEELRHSPPWERLEPRLRAMTRMLVHRHRVRIERLARGFLTKTTLSAKQVDKLVGRSVEDVKVNAPLLQLMHRRNVRVALRTPPKSHKKKD